MASIVVGAADTGSTAALVLLVVIAIIAILAAMLLPALAKAKAKVRKDKAIAIATGIATGIAIVPPTEKRAVPQTAVHRREVAIRASASRPVVAPRARSRSVATTSRK